jgi:hypothetical protein
LLVENAQPCGFVAVFDGFDLAFMVKYKNNIGIVQS